jgi:hypothetical protein
MSFQELFSGNIGPIVSSDPYNLSFSDGYLVAWIVADSVSCPCLICCRHFHVQVIEPVILCCKGSTGATLHMSVCYMCQILFLLQIL